MRRSVMKVRDLINALKDADPNGEVWITIEDDEWRATCVTTENKQAYTGQRALRICRSNTEIPNIETVLHDDEPLDLSLCSDAARREGCLCMWESIHSTSINPPEPKINRNCPLHGVEVNI